MANDRMTNTLVPRNRVYDGPTAGQSGIRVHAMTHDQDDANEITGQGAGALGPGQAFRGRCAGDSFVKLMLRRDVYRRALKLALIVGPVIGLINHGGRMLGGTMEAGDWLRFGLTFLVPYCVSTWSSVMTLRT